MSTFVTYYKDKQILFRLYNGKYFETQDYRNFKKYNYFECFNRNDDAIKEYYEDIQNYSNQIKDYSLINFNYLDYNSDNDAIITLFRLLSNKIKNKIKPINETESKFIEKSNNEFLCT